MAISILPDTDRLRQLFEYDPETGKFWHKSRPRSDFKREADWKTWTTKRLGKLAASPHSGGYVVVCVGYRYLLAHRIAWKMFYGEEPPPILDHINGNRSDNRINNLRAVTASQNLMNKGIQRNSTTKAKGVYFDSSARRFKAQIRADGKIRHLGRFDTIAEASAAYKAAAAKHHGPYAKV